MTSDANLTGVLRQLRSRAGDAAPDGELLARYAARHDQDAFAAVVHRYGGLVLGVARRQLADADQADDVFQATFLALARSAERVGTATPLANWLYTVARRQARKARARAFRRAEAERSLPPRPTTSADPLDEISGRELLRVIDEELGRLPERYRLPILLCCVQGLSREEAAARLGWSDGELKGRLERGRRRLADRLAARGLAPSALVLAPLAAVVVPSELVARTVELAASPWSKAVPPAVAALAASPPRLLPAALAGCTLLAVGLVGWAAASGGKVPMSTPSPAPVAAAQPDADPPDDPLPAGSTLRFGTSRFRHGTAIEVLTVSADGKRAAASSGNHWLGSVRGYDLTDGRVLYTLGRSVPYFVEAVALSPDGTTVASKESNTVHLFDAATGREVGKVELPNTNGGTLTAWLTFTPDGKGLALTQGEARGVVLLDLTRGSVAQVFPHNHVVYACAFSPDGKLMAAGGYDSENGKYFARLWEVATGKERRRFTYGSRGIRTLAFSPDGATLACGGDGAVLKLWEVATGKERRAFPADGYRIRSVAFAPDGTTVAAAGNSIRLYDPATGKEKLRIDRKAIGLHFSSDGKVLTAAVGGAIHRWDAATGGPLTPQSAADSAIDGLIVTPDGKRLITHDEGGTADLWDAAAGRHLRRVPAAWQRGLALSPDGRFLVWPVEDEKVQFKDPAQPNATHTGSRLRLYDLTAGKFVERFPGFEGDAWNSMFTPDGGTLLTVDYRGAAVRVWDVASGQVRRSFRAVREDEKARWYPVRRSVLSPDGRTLAVAYQRADNTTALLGAYAVRLWDVASGTLLHDLPGHMQDVQGLAFSPDGRLLVTAGDALSGFIQERTGRPGNQVFVWDVATGRRVPPLSDGLPTGAAAAAFSPDGRVLATASPDGVIRLWEVATWTVRAEFRGHRDRVTVLTFGPDGRLFSGGLDTTVLAWETRPPRGAGQPLDAAWEALTRSESREAFAAQGRLLAAPAEAVKLIGGKLTPVEPADPKRLAQWIADLDSPEFAAREKAARELGRVGKPAAAALREAKEKSESAEVRRRAGELLDRLNGPTTSPEDLRAARAVEVLEWIGSAEARGVLAGLAKGDAAAPLTQSAAATLRRLTAERK